MFGPEYRKQACFSPQNDFLYLEKLRPRTPKMISKAMKALSSLTQKVFENSHTIGDAEAVRFRGESLSAFSRRKTYVFEK